MNVFSNAVFFALLSLAFAGILDVVFKRYSLQQLSRGMFVFGMGVVWAALQLGTLMVHGEPVPMDRYSLAFGVAAGILVTASNLLLIESLSHLDVSLGSTLYRLNTVGVVLLSFFLLAEPLPLIKVVGIGFAIVAALLLYSPRHANLSPNLLRMFFWLAVLASALRAVFGVVTKAGLSMGAHGPTMMLLAAGCWIVGGLVYASARERGRRVGTKNFGYSLFAGVLVFLIVNTLFKALASGEATIVLPIANLSFIVALSISIIMGMESMTVRKGVALSAAVGAIALLAQVPV